MFRYNEPLWNVPGYNQIDKIRAIVKFLTLRKATLFPYKKTTPGVCAHRGCQVEVRYYFMIIKLTGKTPLFKSEER